MIRLIPLVFAAFLPFAALAQDAAATQEPAPASPIGPIPADGVMLADFLWLKRPLVIFADTPADPAFHRQMQMLAERPDMLEERDVIIITDTDPANPSDMRIRLRPRGFVMVLVDKNGKVILSRPTPRSVREISAAIDKTPLRREELLELRPAGR